MLKPVHVRLARAALRWSLSDLEAKTGISKNTLVRFEAAGGVHHSTAVKIEETFAKAGITFVYEDETRGPGILLSKEIFRSIGEGGKTSANSTSAKRRPKAK